jgi:hypothetical protein
MPNPNRNAPCPCDSGRKYKHCHGRAGGASDATSDGSAFEARRGRQLGRTREAAQKALNREVKRLVERDDFVAAMEAYFGAAGIDWDDPLGEPIQGLFLAWLAHFWVPGVDADGGETVAAASRALPAPDTMLARVLARRSPPPAQRRFLEAAAREPFTYWEVASLDPPFLNLRDRLAPRTVRLYDEALSESTFEGAVLFGHLVADGDIAIVSALATMPIVGPNLRRVDALADRLAGGVAEPLDLVPRVLEIVADYADYLRGLGEPQVPDVRTPDGEPVEVTTLRFRLPGGDRAALVTLLDAAPDFDVDHEGGADDEADEVPVVWLGPGGKAESGASLFASLRLDPIGLTAEVMSQSRASALRARLEELAGDLLVFERAEVLSLREAMRRHEAGELGGGPSGGSRGPIDAEDLPEEVLDVLRRRFLAWADESVPALDGLSPREAVRKSAYRARVIELVDDWERMGRGQPPMPGADFAALRAELGLGEDG